MPTVSRGPSIGSDRKAACAAQPHRHSNRLVLNAAGAGPRGAAFQGLLSARQVWGKKAAPIGCSAVTQKVLQTPVDSPQELGERGAGGQVAERPHSALVLLPGGLMALEGAIAGTGRLPPTSPDSCTDAGSLHFPLSHTRTHLLTSTGFRKSMQHGH